MYLKQLVLVPEGRQLTVRDVVHWRGEGESPAVMDQVLGVSPSRLAIVFPAAVRAKLTPSTDALVLIGSWVLVVPLARYSAKDVWFYRSLLRYLARAEAGPESRRNVGWVEVEVLPGSEVPFMGTGETVQFAPENREAVDAGLFVTAGSIELSYRLGASAARPLELWIHRFAPDGNRKAFYRLAGSGPVDVVRVFERAPQIEQSTVGARSSGRSITERIVKAGDQVRIRFSKGSIRLLVPGRAFGSGDLGDAVTVMPQNTRERFTGVIRGTGEVEVEIP